MATDKDVQDILQSMKRASETVRSGIASAIPVASNQVLTVAIPGTIINYRDFFYNVDENIKPPLAVQVKEARLVDGMIPLSKFTAGKTGKSVARSYIAALDLLVPVEASVSGVIGTTDTVTEPRLAVIKNRYNKAMEYLRSPDDTPGSVGKTKVDTYVSKQAIWIPQGDALRNCQPPPGATAAQIKEAREKYMQWLQEHARDYKNSIQTKYMDWVVHGYKFMVDYNFGIVDISSGMKRIENSKEAFRNLTLIAEDGSSEYNGVVLTPSNWASIVKDKVKGWYARNKEPTPAEIRAELRRLRNLLASHQVLKDGIKGDAFFPVINNSAVSADDGGLKRAYANVYSSMDDNNFKLIKGTQVQADKTKSWIGGYPTPPATPPTSGTDKPNPFQELAAAQAANNEQALSRNNATVRNNVEQTKTTANSWLDARITQLNIDIKALEDNLKESDKSTKDNVLALPVVNDQGVTVTEQELHADEVLAGRKQVPKDDELERDKANPWTHVSCKASSKKDDKESSTFQSASAIAAKASWGFLKASGGASHTQSVAKAMTSMSNLEVDISMDCMVVEIERPWLHGELFADAELDSGTFDISPGEAKLKEAYDNEKNLAGFYQQFSSYPTAFVVASDVELSFSGDTTHLESAVSASSTSANLSVGYGPFAVSASHSQSKSNSKTKMESTATGCKISLGAPQIIGWVQTLLPQLPKPKDGKSTMTGLFNP